MEEKYISADLKMTKKWHKKWQKCDRQSDKKVTNQDKESVGDWEENSKIFLGQKVTKKCQWKWQKSDTADKGEFRFQWKFR